MKCLAYLSGVPAGEKNNHKREILHQFIAGVNASGDTGHAVSIASPTPAPVALIQGWVHEGSANSAHLLIRKRVIEFQKKNNNHTLIIDSNLFNYKDGNKTKNYSRFSFDGVFPPTGNYFWDNPDPARWQQISKDLGIQLAEWNTTGKHILICTQRNGGWSMKNLNVMQWLTNTIATIRKYSDRPIIVRPHPGDKNAAQYLAIKNAPYTISRNPLITQDFVNAHAVITYNSSPGVAAAIEGIPTFVTDPSPEYSQAFPVANTDLALIESPKLFDRQAWIERLAMCHWNREEISTGAAWQHIKGFV